VAFTLSRAAGARRATLSQVKLQMRTNASVAAVLRSLKTDRVFELRLDRAWEGQPCSNPSARLVKE